MSACRKSRLGVFPVAYGWAYRAFAPNASMPGSTIEVSGSGFDSEDAARRAAKHATKFYDDLERYRVRGVSERRLKRPVERGLRACRDCGEPHDCYAIQYGRFRFQSWASLKDGHAYRAESWEAFAQRMVEAAA